jgi:hypothetical protein
MRKLKKNNQDTFRVKAYAGTNVANFTTGNPVVISGSHNLSAPASSG